MHFSYKYNKIEENTGGSCDIWASKESDLENDAHNKGKKVDIHI